MISVLEIEQAIGQLSRSDRSYLAKKILISFDEPEQISEEEKELLERRSNEVKNGLVKPLSLDELKSRIGQ